MSFLRRRPKASDYVIVQGRCWLYPELDELYDTVGDTARPVAERVERALRHIASERHDPERQGCATRAVASLFVSHLDELRAAVSRRSGDPADEADALALLARTMVDAAWEVRGSGLASTVSEESFRVFHAILEEADEVAYEAMQRVPAHPVAACSRLTSARGLGVPSDEWWARFEVACQVRPTLYSAHVNMLQALCKKWYGSHTLSFDFARQVAAESPVGDPVGAILVEAQLERWAKTEGPFEALDSDKALLNECADRWLAGGDAALAHPYAPEAHQLFAWHFLGEDTERCRYHLTQSQGRMCDAPWGFLENSEKVYRDTLSSHKVIF